MLLGFLKDPPMQVNMGKNCFVYLDDLPATFLGHQCGGIEGKSQKYSIFCTYPESIVGNCHCGYLDWHVRGSFLTAKNWMYPGRGRDKGSHGCMINKQTLYCNHAVNKSLWQCMYDCVSSIWEASRVAKVLVKVAGWLRVIKICIIHICVYKLA